MKSTKALLAALLAASTLGAAPSADTFVGTISDDMCGASHAAMRMGPTDAECTNACVEEHDAAYVLVDDRRVYALSGQRVPKAFAGRKVTVSGTLDAATQTITVTSIAAAGPMP